MEAKIKKIMPLILILLFFMLISSASSATIYVGIGNFSAGLAMANSGDIIEFEE